MGLVPVGTNEASQTVNLQDPKGKPTQITFDFTNGKAYMVIESWDNRNVVVRTFELDLSQQAWVDFLTNVFATHIRPTAKATYTEFDGLVELGTTIEQ